MRRPGAVLGLGIAVLVLVGALASASTLACSPTCVHGSCVAGACICSAGFYGAACATRLSCHALMKQFFPTCD